LKKSGLNAIYEEEKKQGQAISIDAYMDVILRANQKTLKEAYNMRAPSLETILTEIGFVPEMIERGRVQGLVQGREQGKAEVVRNLLRMGMSVEEIAQAVELPVEKIRSLV
jgi:predicted transposase/invertase (TIGR01784 family)